MKKFLKVAGARQRSATARGRRRRLACRREVSKQSKLRGAGTGSLTGVVAPG
jgi:hypothetical protein